MRVLGYLGIEIVLYHQHDSSCLPGAMGVVVNGPCIHGIYRPEAVHIYSAVLLQLRSKFGGQLCVVAGVKIPEGVAQCQLFVSFTQHALDQAPRCMSNRRIYARMWWKVMGNAFQDGFPEGNRATTHWFFLLRRYKTER